MNSLKYIFVWFIGLMTITMVISANAATVPQATEFLFSGDRGFPDRINVEYENCEFSMNAKQGGVNYKFNIDYNKVFWATTEFHRFKNKIKAQCDGICGVNEQGGVKIPMKSLTFDLNQAGISFKRAKNALSVIQKQCPGKQSAPF